MSEARPAQGRIWAAEQPSGWARTAVALYIVFENYTEAYFKRGGPMVKIFCSYTHKDEELRDKLESHVALLKRQGVIQIWHDRQITAGKDFAKSIDDALESSAIALLLISADFLASDYCYGVEMTRAMELQDSARLVVLPVILRPCDWHSSPFGKLLAAPKDGKAITTWANTDEAFLDVAKQIRAVVAALNKSTTKSMAISSIASVPPAPRVFCAFCGETAGHQTTCTGIRTHHDFKRYQTANVFCAFCGVKAGHQTACTGVKTHHDFKGYETENTFCALCGQKVGHQTTCTGIRTHHDFRSY